MKGTRLGDKEAAAAIFSDQDPLHGEVRIPIAHYLGENLPFCMILHA